MKVLYITDPGIVGGATRSLVEMLSEMDTKNVECAVCTSSYSDLNRELDSLGISNFASGHHACMDIPPQKKWKAPFKKLIRGLEYHLSLNSVISCIENSIDLKSIDIIHTNSARNDIGCILSSKYNIPHLMHIREFGREDFGCISYRKNYEEFISKYTTKFISISKAVAAAWIDRGIEKSKVVIIYNGVDAESIAPVTYSHNWLSDKILKLVIVGGVCEAKGQLQIVEAIGMLPTEVRKNVKLDIIGWGDPVYIGKIKQMVLKYDLQEQINLLGPRDDVPKLLQNYHIGLMCSRAEGFGRVTAEYMHAGLCVLASSSGANPEIVDNHITGLLYKYGQIDDLMNKILFLYNNRDIIQKYGANGRIKAENMYTKEINADNIYKLYLSVLNKE